MKRFYQEARAESCEGGYTLLLDGRPVRTPGRRLLVMPTQALAQAVAAEWRAQDQTIRPDAMPLTRLVNTVVDQMPERRADAMAEILGYGSADLLCYRQASPVDLAERQAWAWQPWLDWAEGEIACRLVVTTDLEPILQPEASLEALEAEVASLDDWRLVGLHAATRLTGSIILGLAMAKSALEAEQAFELALLEELFEIERWGLEAEQAKRHALLRADLVASERYLAALSGRAGQPQR